MDAMGAQAFRKPEAAATVAASHPYSPVARHHWIKLTA
jgi:hypothetical protein